jgi:spermidine/putrescine-binding protein
VHLTRRQLLAAAAPLVLAGCTRPGSSAAPQTFASRGPNAQVPDPELLLGVPPRSMAAMSVPDFTNRFNVKVTMIAPPGADFAPGSVDVLLVDQGTLTTLIEGRRIEKLDRTLIANRKLLDPPFDDPPFDSGGAHSIVKDYTVVGYALAARAGAASGPSSWADFFDLATTFPGQVDVPDDAVTVIGAALVATGHDWNSSASGDLDDARALLASVRPRIGVGGTVDGARLNGGLAVMCTGFGFRDRNAGVRFVVPPEGTVARPRLLCVPEFAPDPVSAHAWLNHALDPLIAARDTVHTGRATPVGEAAFALPPGLLANPAVFPPALPPVALGFSSPTAAGLDARTEIWQQLVAPPTRR